MARNPLRSLFMTLGTFVGVMALVVLSAMGHGTRHEVQSSMNRVFSGSTIMVTAASGGGARGGAPTGPTTTLTLGDVEAIRAGVPEVRGADPMLMVPNREVVAGGRSGHVVLAGHSEEAERVRNRSVTSGEYFTAADVASSARVALVGPTVVRDLYDGRDPVGEQIRIGAVPFRVIGVLEPAGIDPHGIDMETR